MGSVFLIYSQDSFAKYGSRVLFISSILSLNQISSDICSGKKLSYNVEDLMKDESVQTVASDEIQVYDLVVTMELTDEHRQSIASPSSIVCKLTKLNLRT